MDIAMRTKMEGEILRGAYVEYAGRRGPQRSTSDGAGVSAMPVGQNRLRTARRLVAPFRDIWTYASLADALEMKTGVRLSTSEVGRILRFKEIRPHHVQQWLHSADPDFLAKAKEVCDIYLNPPKDAVVVCVDEKPMQVLAKLARKYPAHVDPRSGSVRYEYEYKRHGTQVLLAAFNITTGDVLGHVLPRRTGPDLVGFMEALAQKYPTQQVYVVWDNLNIHCEGKDDRWTKFNACH